MTLRNYNNGMYAKMFSAVEAQSTEQLKNAYMILEVAVMTAELSLSKAVIYEVLEERGELVWLDEVNELSDAA